MRKLLLLSVGLMLAFACFSQTKEEQRVTDAVMTVHKAIFVNKDSMSLENLIASELTYGHSGGKVEDRKEMINGVAKSKSVYTNIEAKVQSVSVHGKTAVSRYILTGTETKPDGKATELKLNILQVWIKENKVWKLFARQAVKLS
jgi:ketosteroid isomerase-like protein